MSKPPSQPGAQKGQQKKKKKRGRGKALGLLFYGLLCAVGGIYFDRHLLPQARILLGEQVQTLGELGMEQQITGFVEAGDFTPSEKESALADVRRVYRARQSGRLNDADLELMLQAELPFHRAMGRSQAPSREEMARSFELFRAVAGRG